MKITAILLKSQHCIFGTRLLW